jgi:hypothetical protein
MPLKSADPLYRNQVPGMVAYWKETSEEYFGGSHRNNGTKLVFSTVRSSKNAKVLKS